MLTGLILRQCCCLLVTRTADGSYVDTTSNADTKHMQLCAAIVINLAIAASVIVLRIERDLDTFSVQ
jgi:hypothetical protein